jgi:glycosyltransferase involved in cell wall biosynthesis
MELSKMHIGIVTRSQIDYALDLANGFIEEGHVVNLYLDHAKTGIEVGDLDWPMDGLYASGILPETCRVHLLTLPRMRDPRSFGVFKQLAHTFQQDELEVVHILLNPGELWFALLASLVRSIPVVTTMIVPVANHGEPLSPIAIWAINKLAVYGSDMLIVNGENQVQLVQKRFGVPVNRIIYIPLSLQARAKKWQKRRVSEVPGTVLFFGRADPHKGLEYLVKAQPIISRHLPHARILISSHGEGLIRCKEMIQDHSKFDISEGFVSGDVMADFFQKCAIVVLPYLTASTSGVLVTAFSYGKPVVASRVGCLEEYVEDGTRGLLVSPANEEELANAIIRLLQNDELRYRMGANAERWMKNVQQASIRQTLDVYEKVISSRLINARVVT